MKMPLPYGIQPTDIGNPTKKNPKILVIKNITFKTKDELGDDFKSDRYEIPFENLPEGKTWLMNNTSHASCLKVFGDDSDNWMGKQVKAFFLSQSVMGQMKDVLYIEPAD